MDFIIWARLIQLFFGDTITTFFGNTITTFFRNIIFSLVFLFFLAMSNIIQHHSALLQIDSLALAVASPSPAGVEQVGGRPENFEIRNFEINM
jgi:hypothetical protein